VRNPQHLADRGDVGFPVRPDEPLGHVEDEVGPDFLEMKIGLVVGFDRDDFVSLTECPDDSPDGLVRVALGEKIEWRVVFLVVLFVAPCLERRSCSVFGAENKSDSHSVFRS
jgi:hypothetical protein